MLAVLVGDDSKHAVGELIGPGRTNGGWLAEGMATLPLPTMSQLNARLLKYFVKRYTLRRGALMFGKMLPIGIGAVIGGVGNRMAGKKIVNNARQAFGTPPGALAGDAACAALGVRERVGVSDRRAQTRAYCHEIARVRCRSHLANCAAKG